MVDGDEGFDGFAARYGQHLYEALVPVAGIDAAHDATSDTLMYAWRNWERIRALDNPEGYLYVMARRRAAHERKPPRPMLPAPEPDELPNVEPHLAEAFDQLSEMQRQVVYLVSGFGWGLTDVARILDISVSTVRTHHTRGLDRLRTHLKVGMETDV